MHDGCIRCARVYVCMYAIGTDDGHIHMYQIPQNSERSHLSHTHAHALHRTTNPNNPNSHNSPNNLNNPPVKLFPMGGCGHGYNGSNNSNNPLAHLAPITNLSLFSFQFSSADFPAILSENFEKFNHHQFSPKSHLNNENRSNNLNNHVLFQNGYYSQGGQRDPNNSNNHNNANNVGSGLESMRDVIVLSCSYDGCVKIWSNNPSNSPNNSLDSPECGYERVNPLWICASALKAGGGGYVLDAQGQFDDPFDNP